MLTGPYAEPSASVIDTPTCQPSSRPFMPMPSHSSRPSSQGMRVAGLGRRAPVPGRGNQRISGPGSDQLSPPSPEFGFARPPAGEWLVPAERPVDTDATHAQPDPANWLRDTRTFSSHTRSSPIPSIAIGSSHVRPSSSERVSSSEPVMPTGCGRQMVEHEGPPTGNRAAPGGRSPAGAGPIPTEHHTRFNDGHRRVGGASAADLDRRRAGS